MPEQGTIGFLAPDRSNPTEGNGSGLARSELHIALVIREKDVSAILAGHARLLRPPLWEGKVFLHILAEEKIKNDPTVLQYLIDSGDISAESAGMTIETISLSAGYPSSVPKDA